MQSGLGKTMAVAFLIAPIQSAMAATGGLPSDLSIGGMFMQADWIVKAVMIGLIFASLICWTLFISKSLEIRKSIAELNAKINALKPLTSLKAAQADLHNKHFSLIEEAAEELALSAKVLHDSDGVKERILSRFDRLQAAQTRTMTRGVPMLATIGATAPFVGLFGTVWGIMNAFVGIAEKQTTNLAVVAPGIAEALLATALGLVAAIPAVVIYNHFSRQIAGYKACMDDAVALVMRMVSRDLSHASAKE